MYDRCFTSKDNKEIDTRKICQANEMMDCIVQDSLTLCHILEATGDTSQDEKK